MTYKLGYIWKKCFFLIMKPGADLGFSRGGQIFKTKLKISKIEDLGSFFQVDQIFRSSPNSL